MFLGKMPIAPRLVLQAIRLIGVDRGRISERSTTGRHCSATLPALLLQPRTVIAPIALFVGAMVTPRLILQSPSVFRVDDRIQCPHHSENCRRVARRISFTSCSAGFFTGPDFCPIFAPSMATMGQKSSLPQPALSVSQALMPDISDSRSETDSWQ
jgi:hypothetical protein